jgi:hypothetical protein
MDHVRRLAHGTIIGPACIGRADDRSTLLHISILDTEPLPYQIRDTLGRRRILVGKYYQVVATRQIAFNIAVEST